VRALSGPGVRRISVGGAFTFVVYGAAFDAAQELIAQGRYGFG
jgi:hypothetical protein